MKRYLFLLLTTLPLCGLAQGSATGDKPDYPQHYFRNPLDIPIFLAGNFGECRPGHFHSGVDIKTLGKEGQPVHAAADGHISRIKMEKSGFGHGIYITHPNGYTTLYAHLSTFAPAIQHYVKEQQYAQKRWDVDLQIPADKFPVKKGQQIAWSGNTGASTAPHLHFEIRDTKTEHPLNPELFGLPIIDHIAPVPTEVAIYDMSRSIYEQTPAISTLHTKGKIYTTKDVVRSDAGVIGIGVNVNDFMNGSDNTIAFYTARLYMDDTLRTQITLDDIGYDVTRYVNGYADYKTKEEHGKWIQCMFQLAGNHLDNIYKFPVGDKGALSIGGDGPHHIKIEITDDRDNTTNISFDIQHTRVSENIATRQYTNTFKVNQPNTYERPNIRIHLDTGVLYDSVSFNDKIETIKDGYSDKFTIAYPYVPAHKYFDISIKADLPVPFDLRDKVAMIYSDGKEEEGSAAQSTEQGWYKASMRNFGTFYLAVDTVPPVIRPLQKGGDLSKATQITFEVKDAMTSVRKFSGYLDGKWISFEQHNSLFFYKFDEHCPKGKHELVFKASDENNNEQTEHLNFTR